MNLYYYNRKISLFLSWKVLIIVMTLCVTGIFPTQTEKVLSRSVRAMRSHRRTSMTYNFSPSLIKPLTALPLNHVTSLSHQISMPRIRSNDLQEVMEHATTNVRKRLEEIEPTILSRGAIQMPGSAGWYAAASAKTKVIAKNFSESALLAEETTRLLSEMYQLDRDQIAYGLPIMDIRKTRLGKDCPQSQVSFPCHSGKYRSYTGHCNNVQNPEWGNANTPFARILPPVYFDDISSPRKSTSREELPSSREISLSVHQGSDLQHSHMTTLMTFFGEFVFHDLAHITQAAGHKGHRIKCCGLDSQLKHPECMPIPIKSDDPIFGKIGQRCMEYVRSSPAIRTGCTLGPREQINQVTSFLDGSAVYGSSEEESKILRKFIGGELLTQKHSGTLGRELLPAQDNSQDCKTTGRAKCFKAGDIRVNDNLGLTIVHTLFMREHNRVARKLSVLNPHWNDEQLFEESRRIVAAQIQHMTYNEFLPSILGQQIIDQYELRVLNGGFYTNYNININPGIDNAVATAVFAFMYSMMPSKMERYSSDLNNLGSVNMGETYFDPTELYRSNKFDEYLMGMISQNAQMSDTLVSSEMTNGILSDVREGLDFVALVIQQSRDHGLAGYIEWRKICKLKPEITSFENLSGVMKQDNIKKLSKLFKNVQDIDLYTGGLAEKPLKGALVGPTFACLLGQQFYYLRSGDRFWYENDLPPSSFTKEQLDEIRKSSLARIVCDNGDKTDFVQPESMIASDAYLNAFQYCNTNTILSIDLNKWKDHTQISYMPKLTEQSVSIEIERAKREVQNIRAAEMRLTETRMGIASNKSPQGSHMGFLRPKRQAQLINNQSLVLELASKGIIRTLLRERRDRESGQSVNSEIQNLIHSLPNVDVSNLIEYEVPNELTSITKCDITTLPCDHTSQFRTMNGWCNNLKNPEFGKSMRIFDRLLPNAYEDGTRAQRKKAKSGKNLPSPRSVSSAIHDDVSSPHVRYSLSAMQWGQFLDHDLTFTPMYLALDGSILDCRSCNSRKTLHPECWPIPIPKNDHFFPSVNTTTGEKQCLHFVRSLNAQTTLGSREQMNQLTAYIDGSNIYGSDMCEANMLRSFHGGQLNVTRHPISGLNDLLPETSTHPECKSPNGICFEAGDARASEQPGLTCIHTMFMREHNRIVQNLQLVNPQWNDEQLYQTGRKIMGGIVQHITYNEFLPRIIGRDFLNRFGLTLLPNGYHNHYDPECSGTIFNEFAAAAFRLGHTLLRPAFERLDKNYRAVEEPLHLRKGFFNSDMLYSAYAIDNIIRGMVSQSIETFDNAITQEVTNHLFEDLKKPFSGMDLISLNLQRARDHAIRPYNEYRKICNLTKARNFDDLINETPRFLIERLKKVYEHVDDIDLFTGGLTESPLHGGLIGPTLGCILGMQFQRLKKCDRFWYETSDAFVRFTEPQLAEIRKSSLAKVFCENSDSIETIQRNVMDLPDSFINPRVPCNSLPKMDFTFWRERGAACSVQNHLINLGKSERVTPCVTCTCTTEGPRCQSMRISNCHSLFSTFSRHSVLNDSVCKVQCAFAFRIDNSPPINSRISSIFGFSE